jgi:hypothetical protein
VIHDRRGKKRMSDEKVKPNASAVGTSSCSFGSVGLRDLGHTLGAGIRGIR